MKMIHDYKEFCTFCDQNKINPDVSSNLGFRSVEYLRREGWTIRKNGWFNKNRTSEDLLSICRESPENFELAYKSAGIDFWVK